jgi:hypothetical protein
MAAPAHPPPPLVNSKRECDINEKEVCAYKKRRSSIAAAAAAAGATPSPIVQEPTEEKLAASVFSLDSLHRDWEVSIPNNASSSSSCRHDHDHQRYGCPSTMAVCAGSNGSAEPTQNQERTSRARSNPVQEANKAGGQHGQETANTAAGGQHGRETDVPMRPFMGLSYGPRFLGVTDVTLVLAKNLTASDCCSGQSRLQFSPKEIMDSPLFSILTAAERASVEQRDGQDGLPLEAIDRHGHSYNMRFKYIHSAKRYRLMQAWVPFLRRNGVRNGDLVEVWAFRVDGRPMLWLLNYAGQGWVPEEIEAAEGLLMLSGCNNGTDKPEKFSFSDDVIVE